MRKRFILILLLIGIIGMLNAKSFLTPGTNDTAIVANGKSTLAYFDFTPTLYDYHIFGFTHTINENPNMSFSSMTDIVLVKDPNDPKIYNSEDNALYFSYSYSNHKAYEVKLTGADLKPLDAKGKTSYFKTETTVQFPSGYPFSKGNNISGPVPEGGYKSIHVLPVTSAKDTQKYFGNYGSVELNIKATYVKDDGSAETNAPEKIGYVGVFILECIAH